MTLMLLSSSFLVLSACNAEQKAATEILVSDESSSVSEAMMQNEDVMMEASSSSVVPAAMQKQEQKNDVMISTTTEVMMQEDQNEAEPAATGQYAVYQEGVIGNGQTSVLFFHAPWCPVCREEDKKLLSWYTNQGFPLSVYKVDYDSSLELRKRYGVTYQHTFVKIDGKGNAITKLQGPTDSELQALIGA